MKKFKDLGFALAATVVSIGVYKLASPLFDSMANTILADFLRQAIFAIMVLLSVLAIRKTEIYRSDLRKLKVGWPAMLPKLLLLSLSVVQAVPMMSKISVTGFEFLVFLAQMLLIGFCEESLFRGLIQNAFHRIFGEDNTLHVFLGVICGAFCFGATHLLNALRPEVSFGAAAMQAVLTFCSGILFATVYFRTGKNLWIVAVLHALDDAFPYISLGRLSGTSTGEALASASSTASATVGPLRLLGYFCIICVISLFLLRPKKIKQLQEV